MSEPNKPLVPRWARNKTPDELRDLPDLPPNGSNPEPTHSPGPWRIVTSFNCLDQPLPENALAVCAEKQHQQDCGLVGNLAVICIVSPAHRITAEDMANASLIADAPRMLELIRELHDFAEPMRHYQYEKRACKAFRDAAVLLNDHCG